MITKEGLRRIPINKKFMTQKINDILYGYLQSISHIDESGKSFIYKKEINFTQLEKKLKFKRKTLSNNFKNLIDYGFISEVSKINQYDKKRVKIYILNLDDDSAYELIPLETLKHLVGISCLKVITVYAYLLNKWKENRSQCIFTNKELITECLGNKSSTNQRDYEKVNSILGYLIQLKVIEVSSIYEIINNVPVPQKLLMKVNCYVE